MPQAFRPPLIEDVDDSFAITDLVRSGEASRLRRRGAMRIHDSSLQPQQRQRHDGDDNNDGYGYVHDDMPALQDVSDSESSSSSSDSWIHSLTRTTHTPHQHQHHQHQLSCGSFNYSLPSSNAQFKPSPIPWAVQPTTAAPVRISNGCGSALGSAFQHLHAYLLSPTHSNNATTSTVPVDISYLDSSLLGLKLSLTTRYLRSECGCFRTGLSCACCGNVVGIIYRPCHPARSRLNLDRRTNTFRIFFPRLVTSSPSSSPSTTPTISELFTYHLPRTNSSSVPRPPLDVPRPLTPPRPRPITEEDEDEEEQTYDISWGDLGGRGSSASFPRFSFSQDGEIEPNLDATPIARRTDLTSGSSIESGEGGRGARRRTPIRRDALLSPPQISQDNESSDWFGTAGEIETTADREREREVTASPVPEDQNDDAVLPPTPPTLLGAAGAVAQPDPEALRSRMSSLRSMAEAFGTVLSNRRERQERSIWPLDPTPVEGQEEEPRQESERERTRRFMEMVFPPGSRFEYVGSNPGTTANNDFENNGEESALLPTHHYRLVGPNGEDPYAATRRNRTRLSLPPVQARPITNHLVQVDSEEARVVGYDIGDEVLVDGQRVVVDPYGLFLDRPKEDDEKGEEETDWNESRRRVRRVPVTVFSSC